LAAQPPPRWSTWTFQIENDLFAAFGGSDEHYTSGVRLLGLHRPNLTPGWVDDFAGWWCRWACSQMTPTKSFGFAIGQNIYTPDDITIPTLIPDDRPYAGWLYGALLVQIVDSPSSRMHSFELQFGVVGPESGGEWVQTKVHEIIDDDLPEGWDHQLPTEPGVNLIYRYSRRFGGDRRDFIPHAGGALGNVMVMANAGFTLRIGRNISGFPQETIPITVAPQGAPGAAPSAPRPKWEGYLFVGADGRAVAHNIFLDGTVFSNSHSVNKEDFVYDLRAGFSIRYKSFRFNYTFVRRSEEFYPRRGRYDGIHDYGSISLGVERAF
jgi:hypothetical protein